MGLVMPQLLGQKPLTKGYRDITGSGYEPGLWRWCRPGWSSSVLRVSADDTVVLWTFRAEW
jgi:hypothetical protein